MLLTKIVNIKLNPNNKKYFESLGYDFEYNKEIQIPVEQLKNGSHIEVLVSCDYCGENRNMEYRNYIKLLNKDIIKKYACFNCHTKKKKEILKEKNSKGELTKNDNGYWTFKDNRLKELDLYIEKYKSITDTNDKNFNKIYDSLTRYGENLWESILKLGYDPKLIVKCKQIGVYDNFEDIKKEIIEFINKYNRFPLQEDFNYELGISDFQIAKHGGIYELKKQLKYYDENDLVDKNGYYNLSLGEFLIAEFLIKNNISYKRNVIIDQEYGKYNCDFVIYPKNQEPVWIEYWGGLKNNQTIFTDYLETYKLKMNLYRLNKKRLISIYPIVFEHTQDVIEYELSTIFEQFFI